MKDANVSESLTFAPMENQNLDHSGLLNQLISMEKPNKNETIFQFAPAWICNDVIGQIHGHVCAIIKFIWYKYLTIRYVRILEEWKSAFYAWGVRGRGGDGYVLH